MSIIYLDNSATTKPSESALKAMTDAMTVNFGNPSSLYTLGTNAAEILHNSRNTVTTAIIGKKLGRGLPKRKGFVSAANTGKLIFTSGGTESDNLAISGTIKSCGIKNPKIITTDSEHPAVLNTLKEIEKQGAEVYKLKTIGGKIDLNELENALTPDTALISIMYVNNETGAIYDIPEIFKIAKNKVKNIVCHTDCVQAFQKLSLVPTEINADLISVSGHKVHGPKGVGALWICDRLYKKNRPFPIIFGGGQEDSYRPGTESIPCIASFAAAVNENGLDTAYIEFLKKTEILRNLLIKNLPKGVQVNTPIGKYLPSIVSLTLPVPKSQPMLNFLSSEGIYVSSGSACSSHRNTVSHVLTAFGLSNEEADRTIRVSIDSSNTEEEILTFVNALSRGIEKLSGKKF